MNSPRSDLECCYFWSAYLARAERRPQPCPTARAAAD